jgi:hypothetical protein
MRQLTQPRRPRRLHLGVALVALAASAGIGSTVGCGPVDSMFWVCLSPVTGKLDGNIFDANNYANGEPDPCHCYDPCGPAQTCPIVVDAGPPGPGCDAGP